MRCICRDQPMVYKVTDEGIHELSVRKYISRDVMNGAAYIKIIMKGLYCMCGSSLDMKCVCR